MKILGIDTSGSALSVALLDGGKLKAEDWLDHGLTHSQRLMPLLDELLRGAGTGLEEVDAFAVAKGPGSFTGLRIGVASAKALGFAQGKPVVGIGTLEALCYQLPACAGLICPMLDARNNQVFTAVYKWESGEPKAFLKPQPMHIAELRDWLQQRQEEIWLLGDAVELYEPELRRGVGSRIYAAPAPLRQLRASSVALAALRQLQIGTAADGRLLVPDYLRKSQAEQERDRRRNQGGTEG